MRLTPVVLGIIFSFSAPQGWASSVHAQSLDITEILPASTVVFLEGAPPDLVLATPFVQRVVASEAFQETLRDPQVLPSIAGLALTELALGETTVNLVSSLARQGWFFAIDAETQGMVMLARAEDQASLSRRIARVTTLVRQQLAGNGSSFEENDYRGWKVFKTDQGVIAHRDEWLMIANQKVLAKQIADAMIDGNPASLASTPSFQRAMQGEQSRIDVAAGKVAWLYVDVEKIRSAGVAAELFRGRADNPLAELLFGGVLTTLKHTPLLRAVGAIENESLRLVIDAPHDPSWVGEEREFFFGPQGKGSAFPPLAAAQPLLSASVYRDLSAMWLHAGDLFDEQVNEQLSLSESNLTTLFSGRDFGEEILGAVQPEIRLVVSKQNFTTGGPQPAIKLPQFAIVAQLREPETMQRELRRSFQSLIGFLNVVGAMDGQPPLDLESEKEEGVSLTFGTYAIDRDEKKIDQLPLQFNFSPTLAFRDQWMILSSTTGLARELIAVDLNPQEALLSNTAVQIEGEAIVELLEENRQQIIAGNMISKGHTAEEAERELAGLLTWLRLVDQLTLDYRVGSQASLSWTLTLERE